MPAIYTSNAIKCNGEQRYKESVRDERGEHEQTKGSTIPDFEGGMGDFRKNMSCRLISREKNSCKEYLAKKIPTLK